MDSWLNDLLVFVQANGPWIAPILFVMAFGESLAVVGVLLPFTALIMACGGLIGAGAMDPWPVLLSSIPGAILGDSVSYWLGRWLGLRLLRVPLFRRNRRMLARGRLFFRRYGIASIFLGRFIGPLRASVPLMAGTLRMPQLRFQLANVVSAIVWVPVLLAPGYLAAKGVVWARTQPERWEVVVVLLGLAVLVLLAWYLLRRWLGARS
ncbi:DedA family protein [Fodinicurvata fenggangensis]|uniref:DedA family protein n=1 Tax=Fodinicurvata fenggangensis TaxID=1121830 RepID=UPI00047A599B|nr:DedA family protein [Fodinicurvata fenggangensis]